MKQYITIRPDEDGNPIRWYSRKELESFLEEEAEGLIFLKDVPDNYEDPNYWSENRILVLEVKVVKINPVSTKFRIVHE